MVVMEEFLKNEGYRYAYRWRNNPLLITATKSKKYKGKLPDKAIVDDWMLEEDDVSELPYGEWSKL